MPSWSPPLNIGPIIDHATADLLIAVFWLAAIVGAGVFVGALWGERRC